MWGFPWMGVTQNRWFLVENPMKEWMMTGDDWGYPHLRIPPCYIHLPRCLLRKNRFGSVASEPPAIPKPTGGQEIHTARLDRDVWGDLLLKQHVTKYKTVSKQNKMRKKGTLIIRHGSWLHVDPVWLSNPTCSPGINRRSPAVSPAIHAISAVIVIQGVKIQWNNKQTRHHGFVAGTYLTGLAECNAVQLPLSSSSE